MSPTERLIGRNAQTLAPAGAQLPNIDPRILPRMGAASIGLPRTIESVARQVFTNGLRNGRETLRSEVAFAGAMDVAKRASNGLRESIMHTDDSAVPSDFGAFAQRAFENPQQSDHNHEHMRRVERWLEALMLSADSIRNPNVAPWLDSAYLSAYWHDFDQLMSIQRNAEKNPANSPDLPVKKGHALAAAVTLLALHERYAKERGVTKEEAWKITAGAAVMIIPHEAPESVSASISATTPAFRLSGEALTTTFYDKASPLDLTTLSPQQIIELLRHEKKDSHISGEAGTRFGLHPLFEREYEKELAGLENNANPILPDLSNNERVGLETAAEAAVWADWTDMIAPPIEAIFRTFNTQYSRSRPFLNSKTQRENLRTELKQPQLGNEEVLVEAILNGPGNIRADCDSDVRRMLWEFAHASHFSGGSIGKSTFNKRVMGENTYMGLVAFRDIGSRIMAGNTIDLELAYQRRSQSIAQKDLRRAGCTKKAVHGFLAKTKNPSDLSLSEIASQKIAVLQEELVQIKSDLSTKPQGDAMNGKYAQVDIEEFRRICDIIEAKLKQDFALSPTACARLSLRAARGSFAPSTPYNTYNSLGSPDNMRTLFTHNRSGV